MQIRNTCVCGTSICISSNNTEMQECQDIHRIWIAQHLRCKGKDAKLTLLCPCGDSAITLGFCKRCQASFEMEFEISLSNAMKKWRL